MKEIFALKTKKLFMRHSAYTVASLRLFITSNSVSFHFISFHFNSCHFISFHFISFHFISFHFISFHFHLFRQGKYIQLL